MSTWYNRPLVFVRDAEASLAFYRDKLGFTEAWRYEEKERLQIVQVDRGGTELILTEQWPDSAGQGVMFVSLDGDGVDALKAEVEARGVETREGHWGYRLLV